MEVEKSRQVGGRSRDFHSAPYRKWTSRAVSHVDIQDTWTPGKLTVARTEWDLEPSLSVKGTYISPQFYSYLHSRGKSITSLP